MNFSEKLKKVRKTLNMSQMELAEKLCVSFATINRWENNKYRPNYDAIQKFEKLCNIHNIVIAEQIDKNCK